MDEDDRSWDLGTFEGVERAQRQWFQALSEEERWQITEDLEELSRRVREAGRRSGLGLMSDRDTGDAERPGS